MQLVLSSQGNFLYLSKTLSRDNRDDGQDWSRLPTGLSGLHFNHFNRRFGDPKDKNNSGWRTAQFLFELLAAARRPLQEAELYDAWRLTHPEAELEVFEGALKQMAEFLVSSRGEQGGFDGGQVCWLGGGKLKERRGRGVEGRRGEEGEGKGRVKD